MQLDLISSSQPSRERFLTEFTLDLRNLTGDKVDVPYALAEGPKMEIDLRHEHDQ